MAALGIDEISVARVLSHSVKIGVPQVTKRYLRNVKTEVPADVREAWERWAKALMREVGPALRVA